MSDVPVEYLDPSVEDPTVLIDGYKIINEKDEIDVIDLLRYAVTQRATDIHLVAGSPPRLRINQDIVPIEGVRDLTPVDTDLVRQDTMSASDQGIFVNKKYEHGYSYDLPGVGRYRIQVAPSLGSLTLAFRKLVETPPSFDDLGTNPVIRDFANLTSGLVLVAGITGSGKSTLMSAVIDAINSTRSDVIVSIEDPVEIIHKHKKSIVLQRNIGSDLETFPDGIRTAMRQDPDVFLIGEIRDAETALAALEAANTGHLVISTIHALTAETVIERFIDLFKGDKGSRNLFNRVLRAIVAQKLVQSTDPSGQVVPVNEILLQTPEMQALLESENATLSDIRDLIRNSQDKGMQTFEQHFAELVTASIVAPQVALTQAPSKEEMALLLNSIPEKPKTVNPTRIPTRDGIAKTPITRPSRPGEVPFSAQLKAEEEEKGIVSKPSGKAIELPKAPVRPSIFIPPK
jgi:twitching motility protein PilT